MRVLTVVLNRTTHSQCDCENHFVSNTFYSFGSFDIRIRPFLCVSKLKPHAQASHSHRISPSLATRTFNFLLFFPKRARALVHSHHSAPNDFLYDAQPIHHAIASFFVVVRCAASAAGFYSIACPYVLRAHFVKYIYKANAFFFFFLLSLCVWMGA